MQAKDLKPGWWFDCGDGELALAIRKSDRWPSIWVAKRGNTAPIQYPLADTTEVTHHPECTGWDYVIPKRVKLEAGKRYVMRNCKPTRPLYRSGDPEFVWEDGERSWTANGKCWNDSTVSDSDIVSEYVEPEPAIDPGEGWRLLGDDEVVEDGDQCFRSHWFDCTDTTGEIVLIGKQEGFIKAFRRRIEPQPAIDCDCDCRPAEFGKMHVPFTQHTFRKHAKKWLYEKSMPSHWFRPQEVKPHAVLIGALWVEWDRLLTGFEFVGGGVCGEVPCKK